MVVDTGDLFDDPWECALSKPQILGLLKKGEIDRIAGKLPYKTDKDSVVVSFRPQKAYGSQSS